MSNRDDGYEIPIAFADFGCLKGHIDSQVLENVEGGRLEGPSGDQFVSV